MPTQAGLLAGDVDMIEDPPTDDLPKLKGDKKLYVEETPSVRVVYVDPLGRRDTLRAPAPARREELASVVQALPRLRFVSSFGVGFDALDRESLLRQGVRVGYTPGVLNDCVADMAFALMLDVSRGIAASDRFVRQGQWPKARFALGTRVSGKRLGIVGMGRIGQAVAERAAGFRMEVGYHNRRPAEGCALPYFESLTALAQWADYLVLTVAGGAGTRHLVNRDVLDALGPQGYLINVARGSVVDEAALIDALAERRIAGAGLDVFDNEPHVPAALMALDNVVLTPHTASATHETRRAMADLVLENLHAFYTSGAVRVPVPGTVAG